MKALKAFKLIFSFCPELGREGLTLPAPCISENCIKVKINLIFFFIFARLYDASEGFMVFPGGAGKS